MSLLDEFKQAQAQAGIGKSAGVSPKLHVLKPLIAKPVAAKPLKPAKSAPPKNFTLRGTGLTQKILQKDAAAAVRVFEKDKLADAEANEAIDAQSNAIAETMESIAAETQNISGLTLDASQLRALEGLLTNRCSVLIGAAGTGKTTLLHRALDSILLETAAHSYQTGEVATEADAHTAAAASIAIAAFTGRASQQARRVLPAEFSQNVSTIHAMLGFHPEYTEKSVDSLIDKGRSIVTKTVQFVPEYTADHKLPFSFIIIDEASMVPVPLWKQIVDACRPDTRFILIGDIHQLPPVGSKSVLGFALAKWPVFELTEIHRQAKGNPIIRNAHHILHGEFPESVKHFYIVGASGGAKDKTGKALRIPAGATQVQHFFLRQLIQMHSRGLYDPLRDAVIVPKKTPNSPLSTVNLNNYLVPMMNPPRKVEGQNVILNPRTPIHTGTGIVHFAVGDKVMITANINTHVPPITNGQTGIVERIAVNLNYDQDRGGAQFGKDGIESGNVSAADAPDSGIDLGAALEELASDALDDFSVSTGEDESENEKPDNEPEEQRQASHTMTIRFDNGDSFTSHTAGDFAKVTFGYAITCHKAQGGEYPNVFILCHSSDYAGHLLTREWLYTAVTRARENCFLYCDDKGLAKALSEQKIIGNTLEDKIRSFQVYSGSSGRENQAVLPDNVVLDRSASRYL